MPLRYPLLRFAKNAGREFVGSKVDWKPSWRVSNGLGVQAAREAGEGGGGQGLELISGVLAEGDT